MKEFILFFRMDITNKEAQPTRKQMKIYMQQWMQWINEIEENGQLADGGNHLSKKGRVLKSNNQLINAPYISENNSIAGYIIIYASNIDEVVKIAMNCPILNGPNTSVEVREIAKTKR